jgi:Zn-dependent M28 family amino/carboxypeptidase
LNKLAVLTKSFMMKKLNLITLCGLFLLIACNQQSEPIEFTFTEEGLEKHIVTLASDEFMGRMPFTEGEKKTLEYLENEFKAIGLQPGNGESYMQEVPMVQITTTAASQMLVTSPKVNFTLEGLKDYVIWTERRDENIELRNEELVFAGFGVVAPEYGWNDYEGLDVKDKIVVVFVNDPGFGTGDSTFFKGNTMTYYGRWTYKFEEAARQGAKGCLIIHDDVPAGYGFWVVQNNWNSTRLYLDPTGKEKYECAAIGWVSNPTARKLFEAAGMNYAQELSAAHKPGFRGKSMKLSITTSMSVEARFDKSYNAIAKIEGSTRPNEYLVYSAHWDHLGIGKPDDTGDSIYNGALDNASGTAALLEIAKAFATEVPPERTVIFLFVTAEEQGLWGSAWYAENPVYPKERTVANINIDGINPYGKMNDIELVGMGQSELEDYLKDEAKQLGRYVSAETNPVAGYYFRSDHFNFAKVGIPALYTATGSDYHEKGSEYGKQLKDEYVAKYYHRPSDQYDAERWNLSGAVDDVRLLYGVGKRIANTEQWPSWKEGSEFKSIRDAYMKR